MNATPRQWLRDLPVKRKLMLMVLSTCAIILLLACTGLFLLQLYLFKQTFARDLQALAEVIAANCSGAVSFGDRKAAEEVLSALDNRPQIVATTIRLPSGLPWVHRGATNLTTASPSATFSDPTHFEGYDCYAAQPIHNGSELLGTLHLRANFGATYRDLLAYYATILAGVLAGSFIVAVLLSARLQRLISDPIHQLAAVVRSIAVDKDYSVRVPSPGRDEIGQLTDAFNNMVSQIQERDTALESSRQRFEVAVSGSTDGLWDWDLVADTLYFSPRWKQMLGYENTELENSFATFREQLHPEDVQRVLAAIPAYLRGQAEVYEVEFRMRHKDGSSRWLLSRGAALRDASGKPFRFAGSHTDITQRKEAEAELARLHAELVTASRQAGMAEVATGVLHNVGNVLNSVNVSATLVVEQLRRSKTASLEKVMELVGEHQADVGAFLTRDPQGRQLPAFLIKLSKHLAQERTALVQEMEGLTKNIEHIKRIVAMQQAYAKVSGAQEHLPPHEVVEDALRMSSTALVRHQIEVVREFEPVPLVLVDRHKVLQILVNLVGNAKQALDARPEGRRLTLRIARGNGDRVRVEVTDNGTGIPKENLTRIFQHGFTTKKTGHGFGLHSGANAAKEMGGSLTASSEGTGHGATFVLELPVAGAPSARQEFKQAA